LWEIYQAVESSAAFSLHQPLSEGQCSVSRNIESVLINVQNRVDKAVWQTLRCMTLAEVLAMLKEENSGAINDEECRKNLESDKLPQ
jgi:DNA-binding IscR family transcriptional regulator